MRFIDLFAGLGGFNLALSNLGHQCVFASEINGKLRALYKENFGIEVAGDIRLVDSRDIPPHEILCAGFPCQPFSKAGSQAGWKDQVRGTLFGEIARIIEKRRPLFVVLENVGNFERHDYGLTWRTVRQTLEGLGYDVQATKHMSTGGAGLLSPHHLGFPHHRERFFIVASREQLPASVLPLPDRRRRTAIREIVQPRSELTSLDGEETRLTEQQIACIDHWNDLLAMLPAEEIEHLPSFPIWGDELTARYPFESMTPYATSVIDLAHLLGLNGETPDLMPDQEELLSMLPNYARTKRQRFPYWKIKFIRQNRDWFDEIRRRIPRSWGAGLQRFPPSLRKLEWNCKGEERNLWRHILQFRSSGLRVKRYESSPSLVAMTTTQIPILGPEGRFITRTEARRLQGFPDQHGLPDSRADAFSALGNAVHVGVVEELASRLTV